MTETIPKRDLKEHLLEVAIRRFAHKGYHSATLDQIAADAGVSKGAVYWHYKDKAELFGCVMEERVNRLVQSVTGAVEASHDPTEKLRVFLVYALSFYQENPEFAILLGRLRNAPEAEVGERVTSRMQQFYSVVRCFLVSLLRQYAPASHLDPQAMETLASWLIAVVDGLVLQWVIEAAAIDLKTIAPFVAEVTIKGLEIQLLKCESNNCHQLSIQ